MRHFQTFLNIRVNCHRWAGQVCSSNDDDLATLLIVSSKVNPITFGHILSDVIQADVSFLKPGYYLKQGIQMPPKKNSDAIFAIASAGPIQSLY